MELARPGFMWAGALLAAVPLVLHLLRPVVRVRRMLPTARFLTPRPRRQVRFRTRPDQLRLLALRALLSLLLGAAFAGASWVGVERGTVTVLVVDGGGATRDRWTDVRQALADRPPGPLEAVIVRPTEGGLPRIERLDAIPDPEAWAAAAPDSAADIVRLAHLVRAARTTAAALRGYDSVQARVVSYPGWRAWSPGVRAAREDLWPGRVDLMVPPGEAVPSRPSTLRLHVEATPDIRAPLLRALAALGLAADTLPGATGPSPSMTLRVGPAAELGALWHAAPTGDGAHDPRTAAPAGSVTDEEDAFLLLDGRTVLGAGPPPPGIPAPGSVVPLLRSGGRPAAAAQRERAGCTVAIALSPEAPVLASPELPTLLDATLREAAFSAGCPWEPTLPGAESSWRALLEVGPERVEARSIREAGSGRPLERWLLALALLTALAESLLARRVDGRLRATERGAGRKPGEGLEGC